MTQFQPLRGIVTAMVTPLHEGVALDHEGLERLIERMIGGGVHGLFPLGTTGEAPALPYWLRSELIERTLKIVGGRVPVIVGITDTSYDESIQMARKAYESGATAVVAAPPYYYNVSQSDLLDYFVRLATELPLPLLLYNAPFNTHHTLDVATVAKAAGASNIVGLKDSSSDMIYFHIVLEKLRAYPEFTLLVGPDELLAEAVLMGGHGGMAAGSNVCPQLFVALYEAAVAQDIARVNVLHHQVMQFNAAVYRSASYSGNPLRGLKCALSLLGICGDQTASPLHPYSRAERIQVQEYLEGVDFSTGPLLSSAIS